MSRTDIHLDVMLRHLGAAYYESLHGRATRSDVTRALDTVEEHLSEQEKPHTAKPSATPRRETHHRGRWTRRVRDVMTKSVITVDRITPYKEIARLLAEHRISGVPVLSMGRHVVGVVSEADMLAVEDKRERGSRYRETTAEGHWRRRRRGRQWGLTAADLMTAPAVTIHPDATIPGAARLMNAHHLRRLPVVDEDGKLLGIVSRRDLLSVFLRPDADIAADVDELLGNMLTVGPEAVSATVHNGIVTLTGTPAAQEDENIIPVVIQLIWNVDGVVDVTRVLESASSTAAAPSTVPSQADGSKR